MAPELTPGCYNAGHPCVCVYVPAILCTENRGAPLAGGGGVRPEATGGRSGATLRALEARSHDPRGRACRGALPGLLGEQKMNIL